MDDSLIPTGGHDAACKTREEDQLNRWPFAGEVYRIATTSPRDESVRIGVFGDWGSGKSSVLHFVEKMANEGGDIPVYFNPWEFSDTKTLWRAFIDKVDGAIRNRFPYSSRPLRMQAKRFTGMIFRFLKEFNPNAAIEELNPVAAW